MNFKNKIHQVGATLLEVVMVLGFVSLFAVGAITYYNTANTSSQLTTEVKNANTLTTSIRNMFNTQGNYTGLANDVILRSATFPENMRNSATDYTNIKSVWNNTGVTVTPFSFPGGSPDDGFDITYTDVPGNMCADFVGQIYRYYREVVIGSTTVSGTAQIATTCPTGSTTTTVSFRTR
ncbi:type 4 pilus major pilin [Vibrio breoganii]